MDGDDLFLRHTGVRPRLTRSWSASLQGSTAKTTVVERLTRLDAKTIDYRFTISDPDAYTKPWTAVMPLRVIDGLLFEYACHEANYGMEGVLRGARFREREAAKK